MAKANKFEEMLERLVNEDVQGAKDLFHEIVVEKSRNIYESLLENDMYDEIEEDEELELDESDEELDEDWDLEEDEDLEEDWDLDEDWDLEEADDDEMSMELEGPMDDDMDDDMDGPVGPMDDEMMPAEDEPATQGDIEDLEQQLADLQAQFAEMMADEDNEDVEDDEMPTDGPMGGDETDDLVADVKDEDEEEGDEEPEEADEEPKTESEMMASYMKKLDEYTKPVSAKMGDGGANTTSPTGPGANIGGGNASNIAQGGTENGRSAPSVKEDNGGNVNTPGVTQKLSPVKGGADKKSDGAKSPVAN